MKEHPTYKGYFVTEDGRVFSRRKKVGIGKWEIDQNQEYELKRHIDRQGYLVVSVYIDKKQYYKKVHRLVAETYLPNPNNLPMINHKDKTKDNNHISNLEWCDVQYNNEYSRAKKYKIKTPQGEILEVFNLSKWCRETKLDISWFIRNNKSKGYTLIRD